MSFNNASNLSTTYATSAEIASADNNVSVGACGHDGGSRSLIPMKITERQDTHHS